MSFSRNISEEKIITVEIKDVSAEGYGVGKLEDGKIVFVENCLRGEVVEAYIQKSKKNYCEAKLKRVLKPSVYRVEPQCTHFGLCGGCRLQHSGYYEQLHIKTKIVKDALERIGKQFVDVIYPIEGSEKAYDYRNKLEYAFTNRAWLSTEEIQTGERFDRRGVGFHLPGNYAAVLDINHCHLMEISNQIKNEIKAFAIKNDYSFFDIKQKKGLLRSLLIRRTNIGEIMTLVAFYEPDEMKIHLLMEHLAKNFPFITSLQYVINSKANDSIYDLEPVVYKGTAYITEQLGRFRFLIGATSFFQTNTLQAEKLYTIAKNFAQLTGNENVYDLYCGVGSITLFVSDACRYVVGIEQSKQAIEDAQKNASLNGVENVSFYCGDVGLLLKEEFISKHGTPDVIITDPPRAGMQKEVIHSLLKIKARRIVYVSCNPATQARDIGLLSGSYNLKAVQPVDMFPQTMHVENVALLELKEA